MTIYAIVQVKIHDPVRYKLYEDNFWSVFSQFNGQILVNDYAPRVLEGEWNNDKVVLISFPDQDSFTAWATSPDYMEIVKDRHAAGDATILLSNEFDINANI
jgi:uncharacterized protein (DUF1330 family)